MILVNNVNAKKLLLSGGINFTADTIKLSLLDSGYDSQNWSSHTYFSAVSSHEIAASGNYVAGGMTLAGKSAVADATNQEGVFDAADITINNLTANNVQYLLLYKDTGDPATAPLIGYLDLESPVSYVGKNLKVAWNALGIIRVL